MITTEVIITEIIVNEVLFWSILEVQLAAVLVHDAEVFIDKSAVVKAVLKAELSSDGITKWLNEVVVDPGTIV